MATATDKQTTVFGPESNGTLMTPREFDRAAFEEGYRYELVHGVLIVSPPPLAQERDPNGELDYLLRLYQETHPQGFHLNKTLAQHPVRTSAGWRTADRVIWAGFGRKPKRREKPSVIIEFLSAGKRNRKRDYEVKRDEYLAIKVQEYWIIDRFRRIMTVWSLQNGRKKKQVIRESQVYGTDLLPGFELPLARLLALADDWENA